MKRYFLEITSVEDDVDGLNNVQAARLFERLMALQEDMVDKQVELGRLGITIRQLKKAVGEDEVEKKALTERLLRARELYDKVDSEIVLIHTEQKSIMQWLTDNFDSLHVLEDDTQELF